VSLFHRYFVSAIHACAIESENPHFARELSIYDDAKKEMPDFLTGLLKNPSMNLSKVSTLHCLQSACYLALLSSLSVNWAYAQTEQPTDNVLVQSGRLTQRQFDAPTAIYTIDAETIRNSGPQVNLSDVLARAPGVVALNRNNYAQDVQISVRGFGARSAFGLRGFRLITDGIPATTPDGQGQASTVSLTSAEKIEVLTGPLAQLYGNSAGGVIQVFTREADLTPTAQAQIFKGSYGLERTDWQFSQRAGKVGFVADYSTFDIQGYRNNSQARREQLNSVVTADLSADTRLKLIANVFRMPFAKDPLGLTAAQFLTNPKQAGNFALVNDSRKTVNQEQAGAVLEHKLDKDSRIQARIYGGNRENLQYQAASATAGSWVGLERDFHGLGLQIQGKQNLQGGKAVDWVAGFDQDYAGENRQGGSAAAGQKTGNVNRKELNESSNRDYFAQANWRVMPDWTFVTGVRQSHVQLKSKDDYLTDGVNGSGSVSYKAANPVMGATWHVSDYLNIYLNQGKGFETPTLSESVYTKSGNAVIGLFNANLIPARSQHLELGSKWTPSPSTRVDAAAFRIKTDNEIVTSLSVGGRTAFTNASETWREGLELSARHTFNSNWRTQLTATVMNAEYANGTSLAGKSLPGIPQKQLFTSISWAENGFQNTSKKTLQGKTASLDWIARSSLWANDVNDASGAAAGYGLLNARIKQGFEWRQTNFEAYLGVDNLTDKKAVSSVIINQAGRQYFEPLLPRNWVIGISTKLNL
jgi:iron complex outermembrane recepter protein